MVFGTRRDTAAMTTQIISACGQIRGLLEKYPTFFFLCEHLMDYNLARLHEPTLNLSAHA